MKYFLISDNIDTYTGLRLVGIDGVVVHEKEEVASELKKVVSDPDIGIVILTENLKTTCADEIAEIVQNRRFPLIVEIPDRHGFGRDHDSIAGYIETAIGLKL